MSTEEVTYWGSVVTKYIKDKSSYRFTSFDWNDEVIVVSINNIENLFDENNNLLQNKLLVTEPNKFDCYKTWENVWSS